MVSFLLFVLIVIAFCWVDELANTIKRLTARVEALEKQLDDSFDENEQ